MDVLRASGTFDVNGWFGLAGWPSINLNTNGEKRFEAKLVNATLEPVIEIDIDGGCDDEGNAIITEMSSPLVYDDFDTGDVNYFVNDAFVAALTFFLKQTIWQPLHQSRLSSRQLSITYSVLLSLTTKSF